MTTEKAKEMQLWVAMFEGKTISLEEAKRVIARVKTRNKILKEEFDLTEEEIGILLRYRDKLKRFVYDLKQISDFKVQERIAEIERRALKRM